MTNDDLKTPIPLPYATAQAAYAGFSDPNNAPMNDPAIRAAIVFADAGNGIAATLKNLLNTVTATTSQTEKINKYVQMMNDGLALEKKLNPDDSSLTVEIFWGDANNGDITELKADMEAAGIKGITTQISQTPGHIGQMAIVMNGNDMDTANNNLRISLDSLSTKMTGQNLSVQRQMTLYDTFFQGVSDAVEQEAKLNSTPTGNMAAQ